MRSAAQCAEVACPTNPPGCGSCGRGATNLLLFRGLRGMGGKSRSLPGSPRSLLGRVMVGRLSLDGPRIPTGERLPHPEVAEYLQLLALSPSTRGLGRLIQEVARTDAAVLVRGESGV